MSATSIPSEADRFRDRFSGDGDDEPDFDQQVDWFLQALRLHESSNNYGAKSPHSSASGAYQYIDSTWNNYKGYPEAWMAPPHVQDERARQDVIRFYNQYGSWDKVAIAHFGGPGYVDDDWSKPPAPNNPTGNEFVSSVLSKMEAASNGQLDLPDVQTAGGSGGVQEAPMPMLRRGSSGSDVERLQRWLNDNGYDAGQVDGIFGPKTEAAVERAQDALGVTVDGIVGPQTYGAMGWGTGGDGGTGDSGNIEEEIRKLYGYSAWALDHPEIGPILRQAAEEQWSPQRLQGAISDTDWWQRTSVSVREWEALQGEDPATAERRVERQKVNIQQLASRFGITLSDKRITQIATDAERLGMSQAEIQMALGAEVQFDPEASRQGDLGAFEQAIKEQAASLLVPVSDRWVFDKAQQMVQGLADQDNVQAALVDLAKQRYPHLERQIESGTLSQLAAGFRQEAARIHEIDPSSVDLIEDTKYAEMLNFTDGKEVRPMSITEAQRYLRGLPEFRTTDQANARGSQVVEGLLRTFGELR